MSTFYPTEFRKVGPDFAETNEGLCELEYPELWDGSLVLAFGPVPGDNGGLPRDSSFRNSAIGTSAFPPKYQFLFKSTQILEFGFNGTTGIRHSTTGFPTGAGSSSASLWIHPTINTGYGLLSWGGTSSSAARIYGTDDANRLTFSGYSNDYTLSTTVTANAWSHLAFIYDGVSQSFLVNGAVVDKRNISLNTVLGDYGTTYGIGINLLGSGVYVGAMADIRVYRKVLPQSQISALARHPLEAYRVKQRRVWFTPGAAPPAGTYWLWARQHQAQIIGGGL